MASVGRGRLHVMCNDYGWEIEVDCSHLLLFNGILSLLYSREYDISVDPEEPQQVLSFAPLEKKRKGTFNDDDPAEREVASFSFGKGRADWGPLTVYAVMKSGDVYALCPYIPQNA
jgi:hypothetical protein